MATIAPEARLSESIKSRTSAKEAVSSRWASRAEQSTRAQIAKSIRQQPTHTDPTSNVNRVCQTWKHIQHAIGLKLLRHLASEQELHKAKSLPPRKAPPRKAPPRKAPPRKAPPPTQKKTLAKNKEQLANTLTNIRISTALQNQLSEISNGKSKYYLGSVLSILPAGFDENSALTNSIQSRKRAFMLMDLGRVIRAHAQFLSFTGGFGESVAGQLPPTHKSRRMGQNVNNNNVGRKRKGVYIQPQFKVMKNPSLELLKLLVRLGVDLRCNSSDDVLSATEALKEERMERAGDGVLDLSDAQSPYGEEAMALVDDVSKSRKPNGYFRRLLQYTSMHTKYIEVAVDSVDEVHRVSNTLQRIARRKGTGSKSCRFILRLPTARNTITNGKNQVGSWEKLVLGAHAAAVAVGGHLYGVSVDLSPWTAMLASSEGSDAEKVITDICTHLRLLRLLLTSVGQYNVRIDMTGLPYPLNRKHSEQLTEALKNFICRDVTIEELEEIYSCECGKEGAMSHDQMRAIVEVANDSSRSALLFTADVSDHLVARAGALCTRIIGVKKDSCSQDEVTEEKIAQHFYIDDGCYGSLGSTKCGSESTCSTISPNADSQESVQKHSPVPLYGGQLEPKSSHLILHQTPNKNTAPLSFPSNSDTTSVKNVRSTVWGPTCDGLDKVCADVILPDNLEANRDWLVFSNLGCGGFGGGLGLGTAFNGFDPPDVSYCVLNYFSYIDNE